MEKIVKNAVACKACGAVIESVHRHDFNAHSCKEGVWFAVDGGKEYLRRVGSFNQYDEVSEYEV